MKEIMKEWRMDVKDVKHTLHAYVHAYTYGVTWHKTPNPNLKVR